ncbi:class I SAM-dependent methyltransferase [Streptomyces flavidovirens]|uniref:class I SAM-dependent methyltransferase n=1 Tax=Streptomyces flavidovirens TaxID=67298 RepID=UPI0036898FAA
MNTTARPAGTADAIAAAWNGPVGRHWAEHQDRYDAMMAGFNDALFGAAAIGDRDRVLDIGCGSGCTTREAARRAGQGRVLGVDISEPLLARARVLSGHLAHVGYEWGDAQVHPFPASAYDVAISRGGVMFFADHTEAFANIARALRPGGRLAFMCPRPPAPGTDEGRALGRLASLLGQEQAIGGGLAEAMASLARPGRIEDVLTGAGFREIDVTPVTEDTHWGKDAADAVDFCLSRTPDRTVPDETRAAMREALLPYETERGVLLRAGVWVVTAQA